MTVEPSKAWLSPLAFFTIMLMLSSAGVAHELLGPPTSKPPKEAEDNQEQKTTSQDENWKPPVPSRDWKYLVLHHTATARGDVASIDRNHKLRRTKSGKPWRGIGYHFLIGNGRGMEDGQVEATFRWKEQLSGAHAGVRRYNDQGIGICLVGNFEDVPPTEKQTAAARKLVEILRKEYEILQENIVTHGEVRNTACPGKLFPREEITGTPAVESSKPIPAKMG